MCFCYDSHRPGPLTCSKNKVFNGFGQLEAKYHNRICLKICSISSYDSHRLGPLTGSQNQVFIRFGPLEARISNSRICLTIYVVFLVWGPLGHGLCMCSVWFCIDFLDFSTSFFFPFFFLTSCMGPYNVSFLQEEFFISTKKTPYKRCPCQRNGAVLYNFHLK